MGATAKMGKFREINPHFCRVLRGGEQGFYFGCEDVGAEGALTGEAAAGGAG